MLHFLDGFNPIYPLRAHCKAPLKIAQHLYDIQIMKIFLVLSSQHPQSKVKQWLTLITEGCCTIRKESDFTTMVSFAKKVIVEYFFFGLKLFSCHCVFISVLKFI